MSMTWLRAWLHCVHLIILTATLARAFVLPPNHRNVQNVRVCSSNPSPSSIDSGDTCPLPLSYDVPAIEAYFAQQPGQLARRAASLSKDVLSIVTQLLVDAALAPRLSPLVKGTSSELPFESEEEEYWANVWRARGAGVRQALERSGPTFVKFGQALASRVDLVGPTLARELEQLQDRLQPFETDEARAIIAAELLGGGDSINNGDSCCFNSYTQVQQRRRVAAEALLESLSTEPVAAASVSQVYRAEIDASLLQELLATNDPVLSVSDENSPYYSEELSSEELPKSTVALAVKVQRPTSRALVAADALLLRAVAKQIEALRWPDVWPFLPTDGANNAVSNTRNKNRKVVQANCVGAVDEFMSRLFEELDFAHEAENLEKFGALYDARRGGVGALSIAWPGVRVPRLVPALSCGRVLTMEWVVGEKLAVGGGATGFLQSSHKNADISGGTHNDNAASQTSSSTSSSSTSRWRSAADVALVKLCVDATLSQLLETGVMHADPHGGNLLKVRLDDKNAVDWWGSALGGEEMTQQAHASGILRRPWSLRQGSSSSSSDSSNEPEAWQLCYLDLGLMSEVPESVRDGLVSAVVLLVAKRYADVAALFGDLMLLPPEVVNNPSEMARFTKALESAANEVLDFESAESQVESDAVMLPGLKFDRLLSALLALGPAFAFELPPYFLNNARALGALEGLAAQADPTFSVLRAVYPVALRRLLTNPSSSPRLAATLDTIAHSSSSSLRISNEAVDSPSSFLPEPPLSSYHPVSKSSEEQPRQVQWRSLIALGSRASLLLGLPRRQLLREALATSGGRQFAVGLLREQLALWAHRMRSLWARRGIGGQHQGGRGSSPATLLPV